MPDAIPVIGVTGPDYNHRMSWNFLHAVLKLYGARMLRLRPHEPHQGMPVDGLILTGGRDIDPLRYEGERLPNHRYDFDRDAMEIEWLDRAFSRRIPILGICRGAQLINVYKGGSLYQDIRLVCETARHPHTIWSKVFFRKPVVIKPDTLLFSILGAEAAMVNSLHRQSINTLGEGLVISAQEENRIVQAIEGIDSLQWLLGVQWHPEFMIGSRLQRKIFQAFLRRARQ